MDNQFLCISYFDQIIGPNKFYCSEPLIEGSDAPDLNKILEFNDEEGSFIFAFRKYQTANHLFYIDSDYARGSKELVMITYMIKAAYFRNEIIDVFKYLEAKSPVLEEFASELKKLKELPTILHEKKSYIHDKSVLELGTEEFKHHFLNIFNYYAKKLSPDYEIEVPIRTRENLKKIFIFGASKAGKTTFLKNIEDIQFHSQTNNDLPTRIYEIIIENLEILSFDCIERNFECDKCKNYGGCVENAQGYIVMLDVSSEESLEDTNKKFQKIINRCKLLKNEITPILIIGNKFNGKEIIDEERIYKTFTVNEFEKCGMKIKYFSINLFDDDTTIMKALRWLVKHML